jgi:hypothetical protein
VGTVADVIAYNVLSNNIVATIDYFNANTNGGARIVREF